jgi:ankyrin repeat protein
LWAACNQNKENFEIISELIAAGADVNKANEFGYTALMFAATFDRPDSLQVLIKSGSDIHAMNTQGSTALVLAESNGHTDIAEILNALMQLSNNFVRKFCDRPSA